MTDHDAALRIILHAETFMARKGWERSTDFGTRPTEFWSELRESVAATKVWIVTTEYPEEVRARSYYSTADARDEHMAHLRMLPQSELLGNASLQPGISKQKDARCRYYFDAVVRCGDLAGTLPPAVLTPEAVAMALCVTA